MTGNDLYRYRVTFKKTARLRFISHLDLHRTWERALRRAGLPLAYTQGYNPRPRINIGLALPLGCTSEGELLDLYLMEALSPDVLQRTISGALPPGLELGSVSALTPGEPKLQQRIRASEYRIALTPNVDRGELRGRIAIVLEAEQLPRQRGGRRYDLRPLIEALAIEDGTDGRAPALRMRLAAREAATGRPDEVLRALGLDPNEAIPHRRRIILQPGA